ncbi:MAG: hypothetical protein VB957_08415 [Pseudomonadales bacterium]
MLWLLLWLGDGGDWLLEELGGEELGDELGELGDGGWDTGGGGRLDLLLQPTTSRTHKMASISVIFPLCTYLAIRLHSLFFMFVCIKTIIADET